ncbi:MAG: ABC transporter substrate-binding protein [Alphaproteobacteria bacterium]|jgi:phospholipid transport system substrate-binding protein|nr:ABC transporter substrate-binding protein [Alphaproteobacteria bacterium]MDP6518074.1 ABC transporter substrate-binding protein [Alphaproteobacteria bacterium]
MFGRRAPLAGALILLAALSTGAMPGHADPDLDAAKQFVRMLVDDAVEVLKLPSEATAQREAGFRRLLTRNFDMPAISRLVLGRHWPRNSPDQQSTFRKVFETHIVKVYTSQLGVYEQQTVEIDKAAPLTERDSVIFTLVAREDDPPLRLDWRVRRTKNGLKVIDVAAEGVSMLTTKRSEFTSVVAREGLEALIGRLEELNNQQDQS